MATTRTNQTTYIQGNTARNLDLRRELDRRPSGIHEVEIRTEEISRRKKNFSFAYVLFLAVAMTITAYALISYLKLQAELTNHVDRIAYYETVLSNKTLANDADYSKMVESVDFDEIRTIAINELGMVYASEDQIISYTRENSDYVRQVNDLSN